MLHLGDVIVKIESGNKKYMVIGIDSLFGIVQMIDRLGNLKEDLIENYRVIDNISLLKLN